MSRPRTVAIIQARTGSSRFPGKVLEPIGDRPMLWHVCTRAAAAREVDAVVVATSTGAGDDPIERLCREWGFDCFRGDEADVLGRLAEAARAHAAELVVRVTADCPLLDPDVVDRVCAAAREPGVDYATNTLRYTWPNGLDVEAMRVGVLCEADAEARLPVEREHVTSFIRTSGRFALRNVVSDLERRWHGQRWTVDEPEDLEFVRAVHTALTPIGPLFTTADVLGLLGREPGLAARVHGAIMHEGYYRSFAEEPPVAPSHPTLPDSGPVVDARSGARIRDADGRVWIDFDMARGGALLGHAPPQILDEVARYTAEGADADLLVERIQGRLRERLGWAEAVLLDAACSAPVSSALRVARAATRRSTVLRAPSDFDVADPASLKGALDAASDSVAAVVFDVWTLDAAGPEARAACVERARAAGALVVFDECGSGLRLHVSGGAAHYGLVPDLACYGSEIANGWALQALAGRRDLLQRHHAVSAPGEAPIDAVALVAARTTLDLTADPDRVDGLWEEGRKLRDGFNVIARALGLDALCACVGPAPCSALRFRDAGERSGAELAQLVRDGLARRGVRLGAHTRHWLTSAHGEAEIETALRAYRAALGELADALEHRVDGKEAHA